MKTITIILIVLFALIIIFFGALFINNAIANRKITGDTTETASIVTTEAPETTDAERATATIPEPELEEHITDIEIYLDGDKDNGIFLGNAAYRLASEDAVLVYGPDFNDFGFELVFDLKNYTLEPGTAHSVYIYSFIPAYGWELTKKEFIMPGDPPVSDAIRMSIDNPRADEMLPADSASQIRVSGWAADFRISDSPGIDKIEVYIDGPAGFGKFLGQAESGIERTDVGNAFGNPNYNNSGYSLVFDGSNLIPGENYNIYVYAYSRTAEFNYLVSNISIQGERPENNTIIKSDFDIKNNEFIISGWAINRNFITRGVPRSLDIDYALKKIVFVSSMAGNEDIWSMNIDGTDLTQLTDGPGREMYPSISPDGKKIAYSADIDGYWQIFTMNWDGTDKKQITNRPYRHGYHAWSFDGRFIYFGLYIDDSWDVFVMESDGSNTKRLTTNPQLDNWHPYSHPFEYKIVYESGFTGNEEIWEMDLDGQNNNRISKGGINYRAPKYSIDGNKIAFMGRDSNNIEQVFIMDSNGENVVQLTDGPEGARLPSFSPDNRHIVYNTFAAGGNIFIMNADGSQKIQLTNTPGSDWGAVFMYQE
jgi:TolB protein